MSSFLMYSEHEIRVPNATFPHRRRKLRLAPFENDGTNLEVEAKIISKQRPRMHTGAACNFLSKKVFHIQFASHFQRAFGILLIRWRPLELIRKKDESSSSFSRRLLGG